MPTAVPTGNGIVIVPVFLREGQLNHVTSATGFHSRLCHLRDPSSLYFDCLSTSTETRNISFSSLKYCAINMIEEVNVGTTFGRSKHITIGTRLLTARDVKITPIGTKPRRQSGTVGNFAMCAMASLSIINSTNNIITSQRSPSIKCDSRTLGD